MFKPILAICLVALVFLSVLGLAANSAFNDSRIDAANVGNTDAVVMFGDLGQYEDGLE